MKKFLEIQETLTVKEKIELFQSLYKDLAGHGINGDTELAHVNSYEAIVLKAMGGSGTLNKVTGLREYWGDDDDPPPPPPAPTTTTVKQVSDLPDYFKPYAEELLSTAQQVYDRPYVPYGSRLVEQDDGSFTVEALEGEDPGKRIADVSEEQKLAFQGLRDFFTKVDPETGERSFQSPVQDELDEAKRLAGRGARGFDELAEGEFQETYMSPYQKAVTDIQTREAKRQQEQARQQRQTAAMAANALGGSRFGVQEGLAREADRRLLSDIELKGLQDAYTQGLSVFDADRQAARQGATQYSGLGGQEQASTLTGLGSLQTLGETQRAVAQQPLDVAYEEFVRQQEYPRQSLQELSGILRGFQVQPSTYKTSQQYQQPPTLGSQLLTAGSLAAGISGGLGKSLFGKAGGGLASIVPERYQTGNVVLPQRRLKTLELRDPSDRGFTRDYGRPFPKGNLGVPKGRLGMSDDNFEHLITITDEEWERKKGNLSPIQQVLIESYRETISRRTPDQTESGLKQIELGQEETGIETLDSDFPKGVEIVKPTRTPKDVVDERLKKLKGTIDFKEVLEAPEISDSDFPSGRTQGISDSDFPKKTLPSERVTPVPTLPVTDPGSLDRDFPTGVEIEPQRISDSGGQGISDSDFPGVLEVQDVLDRDFPSGSYSPTPPAKTVGIEEALVKTDPKTGETIFDFEAALPWLAMAAQFAQPGRGTGESAQAAIEAYTKTTGDFSKRKQDEELLKLKREELDIDRKYKEALGSKANAWRAIERLKLDRNLTKEGVDREVKVIEVRLKFIGDLLSNPYNLEPEQKEALQIEQAALRKGLEAVRVKHGMTRLPTSTSARAKRQN